MYNTTHAEARSLLNDCVFSPVRQEDALHNPYPIDRVLGKSFEDALARNLRERNSSTTFPGAIHATGPLASPAFSFCKASPVFESR